MEINVKLFQPPAGPNLIAKITEIGKLSGVFKYRYNRRLLHAEQW